MKSFLATFLLILSANAISASVKVTSFSYVRTQNNLATPVAELCGLVSGPTKEATFVRVHIDARSSSPAIYNTLAGADGKFCLTAVTYRGTAEVSLFGETQSIEAQAK